ncbi:TonB-dependent receptor [Thermoflexibacter ruber]|uniref:TonB-dependent receptor n=1 Tax=Thermoflexibacter ruber TaxID=1003 RepID=A0A1I2FNF0_9BACT|nr:TonB-dependent receptor [Thermoflexibacter ruber]SFF05961.1 TonB-dependent receptor [Thermoflexibacter ruber]
MYSTKLLSFFAALCLSFVLFFSSMPMNAQAQTGSIKGVIKDKVSNEPVIGANVAIKNSSQGASTDLDGAFLITKVTEGSYTLVISSIGYKPLEITDIKVEAGKIAVIETSIEEDIKGLEAVVVTAQRETNTVVSLIKDIKIAEQVVVGISSEQISKTQDRDAAQVVKRVPGVSIIGDRFIMVRGLAERYNAVMLNDILTPSSEVDSRAFSFDAVPSGAINRIMIFKSPAAELPGDFSGGVVKIYTKEASADNFTEIGFSTGIRGATTFTNQAQYKGSSTDFLGFDRSTRPLPASFPSFLSGGFVERAQAANQLPNNWVANSSNVSPDVRLSLNLTRNLGKFSNFTAISYSNTNQYAKVDFDRFNDFDLSTQKSDPFFKYQDDQFTNNVRIGVLHNWSWKVNDRTRIDFRNLFNQIGMSQTVVREGTRFTEGVDSRAYSFRYESRSIYSGQFTGRHSFGEDDKAVLTWQAGFGYTNRQEPDWRRFRTQRAQNSSEAYQVVIPPGPTTFDAARFYSNLNETVLTASAGYEKKFQLGKNDALVSKLRGGFYLERKDRDFSARWMSYVGTPTLDGRILTSPLDQIFSSANVNGTTGFTMSEGTKPNDRYEANMTLAAAYLGASIPLSKEFTASIGLRGEFSQQVMNTRSFGGAPQNADLLLLQPLPSVNLSYNFSEKSLIRASYGMTLNRPEFRELSPFLFYDFNFDVSYVGNPNLKNATVQNIDLRWELYPSASEVFNIGVFYKDFTNPVEIKSIITGSARTFEFVNAPKARNFGIEAEARKSLYFLAPTSKYLQNMFLVANASLIQSRVDFGALATAQDRTRPMMNQSPYLVNVGFFYTNDDTNFQWNILYNVFGPRLFVVGDIQAQSIYEMPRNVIDISFTKGIGKKFEIKGGIQDLLNAKYFMVQDSNLDGKITGVDEQVLGFRRGSYFTIGINYKVSK